MFVYFNRDTRYEVVQRHAAEFSAIRRQFTHLAEQVKPPPPPPREIPPTNCSGIPVGAQWFRYDEDDIVGTNLGLVTYNQLRHPVSSAGKWAVTKTALADYVAAATPGYRPTDADKEWASDEYTRSVEAMANVRYVVVFWVDRSEGFQVNGPWDDTVGVEAHIADLRSGRILCFVFAAGGLDDRVYYSYPLDAEPWIKEERANQAVEDDLRAAGTKAFEKELNSLGHGRFDFSDW